MTGRRARNAIDRIINQIDPAGVRERRRRATNDRYVGVSVGEDAMITLFGSLPAEHGRKFDTRLRELAATPCPEDGRTFAQRKADAVTALVEGLDYLPCTCGQQDCPQHRGDLRAARKPLVHVVLLGSTLDGHDDEPGYLDGYGLIAAGHARDLATDADIDYVRVPADVHYQRTRNTPSDTATIADTDKGAATGTGIGGTDAEATSSPTTDTSAVAEDSVTEGADAGAVLPDSAYAYRPNAVLDTWIRILCGTCQWPHCDAPAWNADHDHDISFDHTNPIRGGKTTAASMKAYCRTHHRIKHSGSWIECHNPDRNIDYISPTGHRYHNPATGYLDLLGINPNDITDDITDPDQNTQTLRRRTRADNKAASIRAERRHQQTRIHLGRIRRTTTTPRLATNRPTTTYLAHSEPRPARGLLFDDQETELARAISDAVRAVPRVGAIQPLLRDCRQSPFTFRTCRSVCRTSTRSAASAITWSMSLYAAGISSRNASESRYSMPVMAARS